MARVHIKRTVDKKKEKLAILIVVVFIVIVFGVWFLQARQLFSNEKVASYSAGVNEITGQVSDSIEYSKRVNAEVPGFDSDINELVQGLKESYDKKQEETSYSRVVKNIVQKIEEKNKTKLNEPVVINVIIASSEEIN